jgi:hypothetical protein
MKTPELYFFFILTILGSYLLAIAINSIKNRKKDPLKSFKPFNYKKNYVSFFSKAKKGNK